MPRFRGYNPPAKGDGLKRVNNPNGIYSGMTAGLAAQDGAHVVITDMPGDTRKIGALPDQNQAYNDDADPR